MMKKCTLIIVYLILAQTIIAQQGGSFSGSFQSNTNFFMRDSAVGAINTPQYDNQLSGSEAWLNLDYTGYGFDIGMRLDLFYNSNLRNPQQSFSAQGIGNWYIHKKIDKLDIWGGYIYDQIGTGIIFRAFEARPLGIDNSLLGARLIYDLNPSTQIKFFTGKQRNYFELYEPVITGLNLETAWSPNDSSDFQLIPGFGAINRTLDDQSMALVVSNIESQPVADRFVPKYNVYAFTAYNTLIYKDFTWYVEGAYKTREAIFDAREGRIVNRDGSVLYSSLSYAVKGLGISLDVKRTENFDLRVSPNEVANNGLITFLPPMARQNTFRLTARYNAATQFLGEMAYQIDVTYAPTRKQFYNLNYSNITDLNGNLLYREIFTEATFKGKRRKWQWTSGLQLQSYNQEIFEEKPGVPLVETIIPYTEFTYRLTRKKSVKAELQYMVTDEDFGQWFFALLEYNISPHWSFAVSDMINTMKTSSSQEATHYPTVFVAYNYKSNRFALSFVQQVEGVVCTGGICRLEPAFSGVRLNVTSQF